MKVFAIVVTYNGMRNNWIKSCLDSLLSSSIAVNIIVIDNCSSDNSLNFIAENYKTVALIGLKENLGFGKANNIGLSRAVEEGGDYFFLLNQDATVDKNTIEKLVNIAQENQDFGVISPIHLDGKGNAMDYNFAYNIGVQYCESLFSDFVLHKVKEDLYETSFVCAAGWLLSINTLRIVGGFNPSFNHYAEDNNYIDRLKYFGMKVGVYPKVFIYHDRERRPKGALEDEGLILKRAYFLYYSNPNIKTDPFKDLYIVRLKKILRIITFSSHRIIRDKDIVIDVITNHRKEIVENKKISISNKKFKFLF